MHESLLDKIFDNTHTLIAYLDLEFNFLRVNSAYADVDGKNPDFFPGKNHFDLYPNDENKAIFEQVVSTGQPHYSDARAFEYEYNPERGVTYWDWSLEPVVDEVGQVSALILILLDASRRVQAEQTMQQAQAIAHIGTWDWDIKTDTLEWSDEVYRIFGQDVPGFPGNFQGFLNCVHPQDREEVGKAVDQCLESGIEFYNLEHRLVQAQGQVRVVLEQGKVYRNLQGEAVRMIGMVQDITERKRGEEELQRYREHLEDLVKVRTRDLERAQEELLRKNRLATLGQLTATVSHEIRNPIGAMQPALAILERECGQDNEKIARALERLKRNVARCDEIIDELLDFTRDSALDSKVADFGLWLQNLLDAREFPAGIELRCDIQLQNSRVDFDAGRMERVMCNVLENACHAIAASGSGEQVIKGLIAVKARVSVKGLELIVEDDGCGIESDCLDRIFEPLYSTKSFGVGLGMAVIKQSVEQHGGLVEVYSSPAQGTRVVLYLPRERIVTEFASGTG